MGNMYICKKKKEKQNNEKKEPKPPGGDKIKVRVVGGDVYCVSYGGKTATRVGLGVMFDDFHS